MKGDIPAAAFRLLTQSTVRTHYAPEPSPRHYGKPGKGVRAETDQYGSRAIRFRGITYPSITVALKKLRVGYKTLNNWLDNGTAQHV